MRVLCGLRGPGERRRRAGFASGAAERKCQLSPPGHPLRAPRPPASLHGCRAHSRFSSLAFQGREAGSDWRRRRKGTAEGPGAHAGEVNKEPADGRQAGRTAPGDRLAARVTRPSFRRPRPLSQPQALAARCAGGSSRCAGSVGVSQQPVAFEATAPLRCSL